MTVSTEVDHNEYTGNGATTSFPYTFRIFKKSDLVVQVSDLNGNVTELVLDTGYAVTGAGTYSGGSVVLPSPLAAGWRITIDRVLDVVQETDLRNQGKFFPEVHEDAFDYLTMLIQQCFGWFRRALMKPSLLAKYYDAKKNRISNLADPSLEQDAVNNRSMRNYVDAAIAGVVGGFGWFIQYGSGAVYRTFQDKMRDIYSVKDFGAIGDGVINDTAAIAYASVNQMIDLGRGIYKVDSLSLALGAISSGATITLSGRHENIISPLFAGELIGNLTIQGDSPVTLSVISASISFSSTFQVEYYADDFRSAKYQLVDVLLSGAVQVGNMLLIRADQPELSGCFEVVGVPAENTARVLMLAQGSLDISSFTGTAKVLTTVLQFSNITPIDVSGGNLKLVNIGILGACYPVKNGSRSNVYDPRGSNGVSGIVARNGGIVLGVDSGISGVSGTQLVGVDSGEIDWTGCFVSCGGRNGISASLGKLTFASGVATQNLLDNVITQDQSFGFATSSISAHAGRNGYISSTNSTCNLSGSKSQQNGFMDPTNGNGASASSGNLTVIGCQIKNNANAGIIGIGSSDIRGTGINVQWNSYGVLMDTASHALVTGIVNNNSVTDLLARNRGKIEAINVTHTTSKPQVNLTDGTGALVQNTSGIDDFRTSGGLEVAGGGVIKKVIRMRVTGVDFPTVSAGSQQSVSVSVPGVISSYENVVIVQRDSTTNRSGLMYEAIVSSDNTVLITCNNFSTSEIDPPAENFNLVVFSF
ncbi:hypothetical protein ACY4T6_003104 [Escherichia coli]